MEFHDVKQPLSRKASENEMSHTVGYIDSTFPSKGERHQSNRTGEAKAKGKPPMVVQPRASKDDRAKPGGNQRHKNNRAISGRGVMQAPKGKKWVPVDPVQKKDNKNSPTGSRGRNATNITGELIGQILEMKGALDAKKERTITELEIEADQKAFKIQDQLDLAREQQRLNLNFSTHGIFSDKDEEDPELKPIVYTNSVKERLTNPRLYMAMVATGFTVSAGVHLLISNMITKGSFGRSLQKLFSYAPQPLKIPAILAITALAVLDVSSYYESSKKEQKQAKANISSKLKTGITTAPGVLIKYSTCSFVSVFEATNAAFKYLGNKAGYRVYGKKQEIEINRVVIDPTKIEPVILCRDGNPADGRAALSGVGKMTHEDGVIAPATVFHHKIKPWKWGPLRIPKCRVKTFRERQTYVSVELLSQIVVPQVTSLFNSAQTAETKIDNIIKQFHGVNIRRDTHLMLRDQITGVVSRDIINDTAMTALIRATDERNRSKQDRDFISGETT
jgi:hypothetical protein